MTQTKDIIITQTKKWITEVVIGCHFCPFAAKEVKRKSIHYNVIESSKIKDALEGLAKSFMLLDEDKLIETTLLILPQGAATFSAYLQLLDMSERLLIKEGYRGVYQLASFHPQYIFANSNDASPANYTNRSPYPMIHILREESLDFAIGHYPGTENIPQNNINYTNLKGLAQMQLLLKSCMA